MTLGSSDVVRYSRCPVPSATGIAIQLGWIGEALADLGYTARSLAASSNADVRQSHFEHAEPFMFRHGGNTPPLVAIARRGDLKVVGFSWHRSLRGMLVLPQSGIKTMADLKGRRVSRPRRRNDGMDFWFAASHRGTATSLTTGGLGLGDVEFVDTVDDRSFVQDSRTGHHDTASLWDAEFMLGHQREEAFALIRGEVDAIYSQGAMAVVLRAFTAARLLPADRPDTKLIDAANNDVPLVLTMSSRLLDEAPDAAEAILHEAVRATAWAEHHASQARRFIAIDTGLAEEQVDAAYPASIAHSLGIGFCDDQIAAFQSQADYLATLRLIDEPIAVADFFDRTPLERAVLRLQRSPNPDVGGIEI